MTSDSFVRFSETLSELKINLRSKSRTSVFWLSYLEYVEIALEHITAERTSDWNLHLSSTSRMINLFAATGHANYAKSVRLYLQEMAKLPEEHPKLYKLFQDGHHTMKGSCTNFTSGATDYAIETTLNRSSKGRGGLINRGLTDTVSHTWALSLPITARVHDAPH